jgi:F0F1-type ATP synthase membrane subunit b/b'
MKWTKDAEEALSKVPFFVRKRVRKRVEEEAARLLMQIDQEATRRVTDARVQLAREAAAIAADLARDLLEREISPEDRERIFKKTVERLRAEAQGGGA